MIQTQTTFDKQQTHIQLIDFNISILIQETEILPKNLVPAALHLIYKDEQLLDISDNPQTKKGSFNQLISITPPIDIEFDYFKRSMINLALENGVSLPGGTIEAVPENMMKVIAPMEEAITLILGKFGHVLAPVKKKTAPAKARHKWTKEVSEIEFKIDTRGSLATVMWIKRNQMLIKKGATMMKEAPLNKDGSVGFSAKMGDKIRSEHEEQFKNFVTTEDILLKSVNEVGLFLYYGGTNSWLEMIDASGKTLNEWTVVK